MVIRALSSSFFAVRIKNSKFLKIARINWLRKSIRFRNRYQQKKQIHKRKVFSFYHFRVPHIPLNINENLQFEQMEINRANYKSRPKPHWDWWELFSRLSKKFGIQKCIRCCGWWSWCHGAATVFFTRRKQRARKRFKMASGAGIPLLLIKKKNDDNESLTISNSSISLQNIKGIVKRIK